MFFKTTKGFLILWLFYVVPFVIWKFYGTLLIEYLFAKFYNKAVFTRLLSKYFFAKFYDNIKVDLEDKHNAYSYPY